MDRQQALTIVDGLRAAQAANAPVVEGAPRFGSNSSPARTPPRDSRHRAGSGQGSGVARRAIRLGDVPTITKFTSKGDGW
jgi:hypothetical protein